MDPEGEAIVLFISTTTWSIKVTSIDRRTPPNTSLTPFPAPDGKSGYEGVRPVAQSSQMPPIAPGRRCRAECERAPRVKQHATRPGLGGGTAPGAGRCTGQLAGGCPASRPRCPSPSARGPSRDGAATLRLTIGHCCQQVICLVHVCSCSSGAHPSAHC